MWIQLSITYIILITSPNLGVKVNSTSEFVYNTLFFKLDCFCFLFCFRRKKTIIFFNFWYIRYINYFSSFYSSRDILRLICLLDVVYCFIVTFNGIFCIFLNNFFKQYKHNKHVKKIIFNCLMVFMNLLKNKNRCTSFILQVERMKLNL